MDLHRGELAPWGRDIMPTCGYAAEQEGALWEFANTKQKYALAFLSNHPGLCPWLCSQNFHIITSLNLHRNWLR